MVRLGEPLCSIGEAQFAFPGEKAFFRFGGKAHPFAGGGMNKTNLVSVQKLAAFHGIGRLFGQGG